MKSNNMLYRFYEYFQYPHRHVLRQNIQKFDKVLDLGVGPIPVFSYFAKKDYYLVGVDIHKPTLDVARKCGIYDRLVLSDVFKYLKKCRDKSFDVVVAFDLVEHLPKGKVQVIVKEMSRVAKKRIVIVTENGFHENDHHMLDNPYQEHLNGPEIKFFTRRGWKVYGIDGFEWHTPIHPFVEIPLRLIALPFIWRNPRIARKFIAIKLKN